MSDRSSGFCDGIKSKIIPSRSKAIGLIGLDIY